MSPGHLTPKAPHGPLPCDFYTPSVKEVYILISIISIPFFPLPLLSHFFIQLSKLSQTRPQEFPNRAIEELVGHQALEMGLGIPTTPMSATGSQDGDRHPRKEGFASLRTQSTKSGSPSALHLTQENTGHHLRQLLLGRRNFRLLACAAFLAVFKQVVSKYLNCFF